MTFDNTQKALKQLSLGLALFGMCAGFLAAYGVLSGDGQGQVNLLFLLLLFAALPVASLVLSLLLLARQGGKGLAGWLLDIPLWPNHLKLAIPQLTLFRGRELWFFYQTQIFSLCFATGALLVYLLLLLGTDISFVWRSTLLEPDNVLPLLRAIALPWYYWQEAQPTLGLIEQSRDFRITSSESITPITGLWWKYILAAQFVYNILPRTAMLVIARHMYLHRLQVASARFSDTQAGNQPPNPSTSVPLAEIVHSVKLPYRLLDWAKAPAASHERIQEILGPAESIDTFGPLTHLPIAMGASSIVVVVKSWEPPLAELGDRLLELQSDAEKLILPLDWTRSGSLTAAPIHLEEWQRFAATMNGWHVMVLESSI